MESIISTFHIDWKIIIAQAINFAAVFAVLYVFALKPLSKLMAERSEKIGKGIQDAKKSKELLEQASLEYQQHTDKLRKISMDAQSELQKDLDKLRAENMEKIKKDNEEWAKNRMKQMEIDKQTILDSAKNELVSLAMLAAEKILKEKKDLKNLS